MTIQHREALFTKGELVTVRLGGKTSLARVAADVEGPDDVLLYPPDKADATVYGYWAPLERIGSANLGMTDREWAIIADYHEFLREVIGEQEGTDYLGGHNPMLRKYEFELSVRLQKARAHHGAGAILDFEDVSFR